MSKNYSPGEEEVIEDPVEELNKRLDRDLEILKENIDELSKEDHKRNYLKCEKLDAVLKRYISELELSEVVEDMDESEFLVEERDEYRIKEEKELGNIGFNSPVS